MIIRQAVIFTAMIFLAPLFILSQTSNEDIHVTRADFAASYLRFEQALLAAQLDMDETARVNREFDALTLLFFSRRYDLAVKKLHELTASLISDKESAAPASLAVRAEPAVFVLNNNDIDPSLRVESLYPWHGESLSMDMEVRIYRTKDKSGIPVVKIPFAAEWLPGEKTMIPLSFPNDISTLEPGLYDLSIFHSAGRIRTGSWNVVKYNLDSMRVKNSERISSLNVDPENSALFNALQSVIARNNLLSQNPSPENTAQAVLDLALLADSVDSEIEMLRQGKNPFRERSGDVWRVIPYAGKRIPVRIYVPNSEKPESGWPLAVAFHGAGGDENMFMEGYGAGLIRRLADTHRMIIASPLTNAFRTGDGPSLFDSLLNMLNSDYSLDKEKVYLLGHSMGAGTVNRLISARARQIAAAACICGFHGFSEPAKDAPSILVIAAELDPLANPERIQAITEKAVDLGYPLDYIMIKGYGHTLVVARELPAVFEWLINNEL